MYSKLYLIRSYTFGIAFALSAMVISGCKKGATDGETATTIASLSDAELIKNAKTFFESSASKSTKASNNLIPNKPDYERSLSWDQAYTDSMALGKYVRVPVKYASNRVVKVGNKMLSLNDLTRVFVYKDEKGDMQAEVVTRIPDQAYLANIDPHKKFSGVVMVEDWKGNYLKGYSYADGVARSIGVPEYRSASTSDKRSLSDKQSYSAYECHMQEYGTVVTSQAGTDYNVEGSYWVCSGGNVTTESPLVDAYQSGNNHDGSTSLGNSSDDPYQSANNININYLVLDPCLQKFVTAAVQNNVAFNTSQTLHSVFGTNSRINLTIIDSVIVHRDGSVDYDTQGITTESGVWATPPSSGRVTITQIDVKIKLNNQTLPNASKEFTTAILLHELLHAYFRALGVLGDHDTMVRNYIPWFEGSLKATYPYLTNDEVSALAYSGLMDNQAWGKYNEGTRAFFQKIQGEFKDLTRGQPCL